MRWDDEDRAWMHEVRLEIPTEKETISDQLYCFLKYEPVLKIIPPMSCKSVERLRNDPLANCTTICLPSLRLDMKQAHELGISDRVACRCLAPSSLFLLKCSSY